MGEAAVAMTMTSLAMLAGSEKRTGEPPEPR